MTATIQILPTELGSMPQAAAFGNWVYFGGQPQLEDFSLAAKLGIQTVINLRTPAEMGQLGFNERAVVEAAGMQYLQVPIGHQLPTSAELQPLMEVLEAAHQSPVLFHCASSNRVGLVWALYRVWYHELTIEQAVEEGTLAGMLSPQLQALVRQLLAQPHEIRAKNQ